MNPISHCATFRPVATPAGENSVEIPINWSIGHIRTNALSINAAGFSGYVLRHRHRRQLRVMRPTAPLVGAEASFIAVMSGMIPKGNGSQHRVDVYERSFMRARRTPEGLNVTTRRAETVAAIPVVGLRPGRSFFERTWKEPKDRSLRSSPETITSKISARTASTMPADSTRERPTRRSTASTRSARARKPARLP